MPQTSYALTMSTAYEGGRASSEDAKILPGLNKDVIELPFGRAVVLGSTTGLGPNDVMPVIAPVDANSVLIGVAMHSHAHDPNNTNGVPVGDMLNVITEGDVWVQVEQAVVPGDAVYFRHTVASGTGTSIALGRFRKDADTAKATQIVNAKWLGKAAAGEIVALRLGASVVA